MCYIAPKSHLNPSKSGSPEPEKSKKAAQRESHSPASAVCGGRARPQHTKLYRCLPHKQSMLACRTTAPASARLEKDGCRDPARQGKYARIRHQWAWVTAPGTASLSWTAWLPSQTPSRRSTPLQQRGPVLVSISS